MGTINARDSSVIDISLFFINHGWVSNLVDYKFRRVRTNTRDSLIQKADAVLRKLKEVHEWA